MLVEDSASSGQSRTMADYSARSNPQSVSQEALLGSIRLIGHMMVLPYNHVPHSSLGSAHDQDLDVTLYGIKRDLAPYHQTVTGTNTHAIQTTETARTMRHYVDQLTAAAGVLEETYTLLNSLQATSQKLAADKPSAEYGRAVSRHRNFATQYEEFLRKSHDAPWAFIGKYMPTFTIAEPHDVTHSAPFVIGRTLTPRSGTSCFLSTTPFHYRVQDHTVYMYTLPRSPRTQLPEEMDIFPGALELSRLY